MIILPVRSVYTTTHCTYKGTMMAYREPHRNDIITPGASTVAKFKTIMTLNLRDSKLSQTERQVNALIMSCLFTHPTSFVCRHKTRKRLGVNGDMDASVLCIRYNPPNYPIAKVQFFFQTKERK